MGVFCWLIRWIVSSHLLKGFRELGLQDWHLNIVTRSLKLQHVGVEFQLRLHPIISTSFKPNSFLLGRCFIEDIWAFWASYLTEIDRFRLPKWSTIITLCQWFNRISIAIDSGNIQLWSDPGWCLCCNCGLEVLAPRVHTWLETIHLIYLLKRVVSVCWQILIL